MYQISGNKIYWPANDVTPITLNCGIKNLTFSNTSNIKISGSIETAFISLYSALLDHIPELPNVYGYPNKIIPLAHDKDLNVVIVPSPHINPHYVTDCQKTVNKWIQY